MGLDGVNAGAGSAGLLVIYLLHLLINWLSAYPASALFFDAILGTIFLLLVFIFILARFKGLQWTMRHE